jgi:hypothetical protein
MLALSPEFESVQSFRFSAESAGSEFLERCFAALSSEASALWDAEVAPHLDMFEAKATQSPRHNREWLYLLRDRSREFREKHVEHLTDRDVREVADFADFVDALDLFDQATAGFPSLPTQLTMIKRLKKFRNLASALAAAVPAGLGLVQGSHYAPGVGDLYIKVLEMISRWSQVKLCHIAPRDRGKARVIQRQIANIVKTALDEIGYIVNSAEAKAIRRIQDEEPIEWEVAYQPGAATNIDAIRSRLKQRGTGKSVEVLR